MEVDEPRRQPVDPSVPAEMADLPRESVREAADEPRRGFSDSLLVTPAEGANPVPHDPDLPHPVQEEADEPRKRPSG